MVPSRTPDHLKRALFILIAASLVLGPTGAAWAKPGNILVAALLDRDALRQHPGFKPPSIWVYDEVGTAIPSQKSQGAFEVGEKIQVEPGWYQVEVGNVHAERNRVKILVKSGKTTVVPTGLIVVNVEPSSAQPRDRCNRWTGELYVTLPTDPKPGPTIATNQGVGHHAVGIVQVVAGYYRIQWNRFWIAADVKENMAYRVQTGLIGPMPQSDYALHLKKGIEKNNPGLRLCQKRPTRVMARTYWGTWNRQISAYPFKQREWQQITVEKPIDKRGPYQKLGKPKIPGPIFRGAGSKPVHLWELPEAPAPKAPPTP